MPQNNALRGEEIIQIEAIKLRKIFNTTKDTVLIDKSLADIVKGKISFSDTFQLVYEMKFLQAHAKGIEDDRVPSRYLLTPSLSSHPQDVRLVSILSRRSELLLALEMVESLKLRMQGAGGLASGLQCTVLCWKLTCDYDD